MNCRRTLARAPALAVFCSGLGVGAGASYFASNAWRREGDTSTQKGSNHLEGKGREFLEDASNTGETAGRRVAKCLPPKKLKEVEAKMRKWETSYPVLMYVKRSCRFCHLAKEAFQGLGVPESKLGAIDLETYQPSIDVVAIVDFLYRRNKTRTVPQIFVGQEFLGGYEDVATLHRKGELLPKLKAAKALPQSAAVEFEFKPAY